jgi:hypothetical protein
MAAMPVAARAMFGQEIAHPQAASVDPVPPAAAETAAAAATATPVFDYRVHPIPSAVADAVATTEAHFFSDRQLATLRRLCDVLMPPLHGYPGAVEAGTPEFIDFLIGVSPAEDQHMYRAGLDRLQADAGKQFDVPFAQVNADQADRLLRPWLRTWMKDHPPAEPYARFINLAHHTIREATMNSEVWSNAATAAGERAPGIGLYWSPVDPDLRMPGLNPQGL